MASNALGRVRIGGPSAVAGRVGVHRMLCSRVRGQVVAEEDGTAVLVMFVLTAEQLVPPRRMPAAVLRARLATYALHRNTCHSGPSNPADVQKVQLRPSLGGTDALIGLQSGVRHLDPVAHPEPVICVRKRCDPVAPRAAGAMMTVGHAMRTAANID